MHRRRFLAVATAGMLSGCSRIKSLTDTESPPAHDEISNDLHIQNKDTTKHTVNVEVSQDGKVVHEESYTVAANQIRTINDVVKHGSYTVSVRLEGSNSIQETWKAINCRRFEIEIHSNGKILVDEGTC